MSKRIILGAAAVVGTLTLALTGCGATSGTHQSVQASTTTVPAKKAVTTKATVPPTTSVPAKVLVPTKATVPPPTTVPDAPTTTTAPSPTTAEGMAMKMKAAGLPITDVVVYTAATDPNHQLGRPNGYLSKVAWVDSRTGETLASGLGVSQGGSVEVFATPADAAARAHFIQAIAKASPPLANEYDYLIGRVLVRCSGKLTPAQATAYGKAVGATLYTLP